MGMESKKLAMKSCIAVRVSWAVFTATAAASAHANDSEAGNLALIKWPPLPKAVTSFGAEALDGHVYVYGGHTGKAHDYSVETTLGNFMRLRLVDGAEWENLPGANRAQGARLVAFEGALYRLGGMQPRKEADGHIGLYSLADFARYDLRERQWTALSPMPEERSSHEAVIVGSKIYVGGGWKMEGEAGGKFWHNTMFVVDLKESEPKWKLLPQPFRRRALSAESADGKIYFIGGMDEDNNTSREVDVYDTTAGKWRKGPALPSGPMQGFGSAACRVNGRLIVSPYSANLWTLNATGDDWENLGKLTRRRFFHRIVPMPDGRLLAIAGASRQEGHLSALEEVDLARRRQ